jgi:hypothetical protein
MPDSIKMPKSSLDPHFEGMCLLLWLTHGPNDNFEENRPLKWFAYEYIERYRQMNKGNFDEIMDLNTKKAILQGVQEYSHLFLTNEAIDLLRQGKDLPCDPFIKGWPSKKLPAIVEELQNQGLIDQKVKHYEALYGSLSQWLHWTPQGMGSLFCYDGNRISYDADKCKFKGVGAIIIGLQSLANSAFLFNNHFKLNFGDKLAELGEKYSELWFNE